MAGFVPQIVKQPKYSVYYHIKVNQLNNWLGESQWTIACLWALTYIFDLAGIDVLLHIG